MLRRTLIAVFILVMICGSMIVLPHFLLSYVVSVCAPIDSMRVTDSGRMRLSTQGIVFCGVGLMCTEDVVVSLDECTITLPWSVVRGARREFFVRCRSGSLSFEKMPDLMLKEDTIAISVCDVHIREAEDALEFLNGLVDTDLGRISLAGKIGHDGALDFDGVAVLDFRIINALNLPFSLRSNGDDSMQLNVSLAGTVSDPDIIISAGFFQFRLSTHAS